MTTLVRVRTDWQARYHVLVDAEASVINAFTVCLPPYLAPVTVVQRDDMSIEEAWADALLTLASLRTQPYTPLFPVEVFAPFGVITARNLADVQREQAIKTAMMEARQFHTDERHRARVEADPVLHEGAHDRRVADLCRAWSLLNGSPLPKASFDSWPPVRH